MPLKRYTGIKKKIDTVLLAEFLIKNISIKAPNILKYLMAHSNYKSKRKNYV